MAPYENHVTLKAYIGKDAQSFATRHENTFVVLSLATKSGYKDKRKIEWVNHTEWHRIVAFNKPADYAKTLKDDLQKYCSFTRLPRQRRRDARRPNRS